jgi:hypothetical protein
MQPYVKRNFELISRKDRLSDNITLLTTTVRVLSWNGQPAFHRQGRYILQTVIICPQSRILLEVADCRNCWTVTEDGLIPLVTVLHFNLHQ